MADPHEFAVAIADLDAGGRAYEFPIRSQWVRQALEGTAVDTGSGDGRLDLRLSKSGTDVVIRGSLRAQVVVPCARCLEPAKIDVSEEISALAVPQAAMRDSFSDDDADLAPEQADMIPYDGETVVLDDLLRDELLLGIPMIPLCSEGCPGISPRSEEPSEEATIDPRLSPLLYLKKIPNQQ